MQTKSVKILVCLALVAATLALFWRVTGHDFINYDDEHYVTENYRVRAGLNPGNIKWAFTTFDAANWHPFTWLSHMADCTIFGMDAGGHHLTSLILHVVNTLLLFMILCSMTGAAWRSLFVACLFALHPLHVESVAWIAERKDVLSTFFWMATTGAYVWYARSPGAGRYIPVVILFCLGLMAKPMLVTLPFVLLLLDYWPLARHRPAARPGFGSLVLEKAPLFLLSAASSVVTIYAQASGGAVSSLEKVPFVLRAQNALVSYAAYIIKTVWPANLAIFYPYPASIPGWKVAACAGFLALVSAGVIAARKRHPYLLVGWLWYLGTLVPVIGLVKVGDQAMADRYTYVPLIGLFIMAAWSLPELFSRFKQGRAAPAAVAVAALVGLSAATWLQVGHWKDSITLFTRAALVTGDNHLAHMNLGSAFLQRGRLEGAQRQFKKALAIKNNYYEALGGLGLVELRKGRFEDAAALFTRALRARPGDPDLNNNLGSALEARGRLGEAAGRFRDALKAAPGYFKAHNNLGVVLEKLGKVKDAERHYLLCLGINPYYFEAHNNLGVLLAKAGRLKEAMERFEKAVHIEPGFARAHNNMGNVLAMSGRPREAAARYRAAIEVAPDYAEPRNNLGVLLMREQRFGDALKQFDEALRIAPGYRDARLNRDQALKLMREHGPRRPGGAKNL